MAQQARARAFKGHIEVLRIIIQLKKLSPKVREIGRFGRYLSAFVIWNVHLNLLIPLKKAAP